MVSRKFYLYRMSRMILTFVAAMIFSNGVAQTEDAVTLHENAKKFMRQGDYANATIILVRANEQAPYALPIAKDLALCYYMQSENNKALSTIKPFMDKDFADEQAYQIMGMVYKRMGQNKDADKLYKKALKAFPRSGPLYNDYGELLWAQQDYSAINQWEKGIKEEPGFPGNYYNAARHYYLSQDKIRSLIYGEIFVNLESGSARTAEIKEILLNSYKKLFIEPNLLADTKGKSKFELAFLSSMNKQNDIVVRGINVETLTMIRTRFVLDWHMKNADEFPSVLFDTQKYMLENGHFQAYNQWLFGPSENTSAFQNWIKTHAEEYQAFNRYLENRNFAVNSSQYLN